MNRRTLAKSRASGPASPSAGGRRDVEGPNDDDHHHDRLRPLHAAEPRLGAVLLVLRAAAGCGPGRRRGRHRRARALRAPRSRGPRRRPADPRVRAPRPATRPTRPARAGRPSSRCGWIASRPSISARPAPTPTVVRFLALVSVCGPVNDRDCRTLLKLNARIVEGHFAIRVLRGEEYFVVIENVPAEALPSIDVAGAGPPDRRAGRRPGGTPVARRGHLLRCAVDRARFSGARRSASRKPGLGMSARPVDGDRRVGGVADRLDALERPEIARRSPRAPTGARRRRPRRRSRARVVLGRWSLGLRRPDGVTAARDAVAARLGVAEVEERQIAELGTLALELGQRLEALRPVEVRVREDPPAADRPAGQDVEIRQLIGMDRRDRPSPARPGRPRRAVAPRSVPRPVPRSRRWPAARSAAGSGCPGCASSPARRRPGTRPPRPGSIQSRPAVGIRRPSAARSARTSQNVSGTFTARATR